MKKNQQIPYKTGPDKYVRFMQKLFIVWSVVAIPAVMIFLVCAFNTKGIPQIVHACVASALILGYLVSYGFFAMRVSMGTVLGVRATDKVVYLATKRKTFTYDVREGCVGVKVHKSRYLCTFETQDSRDKFLFYKHAPFTKYSDAQFTDDDIRTFCPWFTGEDL